MRLERITDHTFAPDTPPGYLTEVSRRSARGILMDENRRVCMIHMTRNELYKLPGGGMELEETKEQAFLREVYEETGYRAKIVAALGVMEEHKLQHGFLQVSHCFIAECMGPQHAPSPTDSEIRLGIAPQWMTYRNAIRLLARALDTCTDYGTRFMLLRDRRILESATDYFVM